MSIIQSAGIFIPDLKSEPHINFSRFRGELYNEAMNTENAILGQYGLLFIFLTEAEWEALPGNLVNAAIAAVPAVPGGAAAIAAAPAVYRARYDFTTPVPRPPNNAANAVLKEVELQTNNKAAVYKAYLNLRAKLINSMADEDISALSQYPYGVGTRSATDLYNHVVVQYSQLTQDDFTTIIGRLRSAKTATQTYSALASAHRDLHAILLTAGQPLSELDKCNYLIDALNRDAAGMYGAQLYAQAYPLIHQRTFNGLVSHINLHSRNAIVTTGSLNYASAATVVAPIPVPAPAYGAADFAALAAENAQLKKDLKALRKSIHPATTTPTTTTTTGRSKYYCWVHGTCYHSGSRCTVMLADTTKYTAAHLNSVSSSHPPGGKA